MNILIVGLVKNPQLLRLIEEGDKHGHRVSGCYVSDLIINASNESFDVFLNSSKSDLKSFDLIYLWSVGKKRWEWYMASLFLHEMHKTKIVNSKVVDDSYKLYLTPAMNYNKQMKHNLPFPKSMVVFNNKAIPLIEEKFKYPLIIKTSQGRQGRGVFKIENSADLKAKIKEMQEVKEPIIIREFIPNEGDIRVFTVGYKALGAMKRTPPSGDFRSNISVGGEGENYDLSKNPEIRRIAEKASEITGTEIAGVDIMINKETGNPYILEINPGPQFTGFEKYTGINAAGKIIEYFEGLKEGK